MNTRRGLNSRLTRLEKVMRARSLGDPRHHMIVIEKGDQSGVYRGTDKDGVERLWSQEELESLEASGVNITKIILTHGE